MCDVTLAGVKKRMDMPNRRQVSTVLEPVGEVATCALCLGLYRERNPLPGHVRVCTGCRTEAGRLGALGDPRSAAHA